MPVTINAYTLFVLNLLMLFFMSIGHLLKLVNLSTVWLIVWSINLLANHHYICSMPDFFHKWLFTEYIFSLFFWRWSSIFPNDLVHFFAYYIEWKVGVDFFCIGSGNVFSVFLYSRDHFILSPIYFDSYIIHSYQYEINLKDSSLSLYVSVTIKTIFEIIGFLYWELYIVDRFYILCDVKFIYYDTMKLTTLLQYNGVNTIYNNI